MSGERLRKGPAGLNVLTFDILERYGINHGMVVKDGGKDVDKDLVYSRLAAEKPLVVTHQVHGDSVISIDKGFSDYYPQKTEADGLMTSLTGIRLSIHTADCVPVFLADKKGRAVCLIHAGWRGTKLGVAAKGIKSITGRFGLGPEEVVAAIGPCIELGCYEVGEDVADSFATEVKKPAQESKWLLDLRAENARQLFSEGLGKRDLHISGLCTRCRPDTLHSYRNERELKGQMISFMEAGI
jgi:hypothetical protein